MQLLCRVEQILSELRPAFSRQAAFEWFVVLMWGVLLCSQAPAVTSYLNAVGLSEYYYHQALHWFHSRAWSVVKLSLLWQKSLLEHRYLQQLNSKPVYIGDGIKISKEGRKMPGVKRLHQESENLSKKEWIRGHYFGCLSLLLGEANALFAVPVLLRVQDGLQQRAQQTTTLVEKMADMCVGLAKEGSYIVLDSYFAAGNLLASFRQHKLHLITRVRINTVGKHPLPPPPAKRGRGKPPIWGKRVKLRTLFDDPDSFKSETVILYGKLVTVRYRTIDLYWDSPQHLVRFVLTVLPCGKQLILLASDLTLNSTEIIMAYGWRFKIEVTFRTLIQLLSGFSYRFWMKALPPSYRWPKNTILSEFSASKREQIKRKITAIEGFVNLNALALGILQLLSLEMPAQIWRDFPRWFRTLPEHGYPSEQIVRLTLQDRAAPILAKCSPSLLLTKFISIRLQVAGKPPPECVTL